MSEVSQPKPSNVREAFCRRYGCPPAEFERRLFLKSLRLHARILMPFLGWFRPHAFNADWSVVEVMGRVRTAAEMEERISEFVDWNLIDRSRRRRLLFLRISAAKLRNAVEPLLKGIEPASAHASAPGLASNSSHTLNPPREQPAAPPEATPRAATVRAVAHRQADLEERVRQLEEENARLREIVAHDAIELAALRGTKR